MDAHDSQEQVPEEPFGVAQERALALDASQLPEQSQRNVFLVRDPVERLLARPDYRAQYPPELAPIGCT